MAQKHNAKAKQLIDENTTDKDLIKLKELTYLTRLVLHSTKISDAGLAHLKSFTNLTTLGLYYTR